jgi:hypothetical protein
MPHRSATRSGWASALQSGSLPLQLASANVAAAALMIM